jgi:hypothetical protein
VRDGKTRGLPISEITIEEGAGELIRSERMKPYLALLKVQVGGQDSGASFEGNSRAAA